MLASTKKRSAVKKVGLEITKPSRKPTKLFGKVSKKMVKEVFPPGEVKYLHDHALNANYNRAAHRLNGNSQPCCSVIFKNGDRREVHSVKVLNGEMLMRFDPHHPFTLNSVYMEVTGVVELYSNPPPPKDEDEDDNGD